MIDKQIIKNIILENQKKIPQINYIYRDIQLDKNTNYVFVGLRRAGKSFTIFQNISERIKNKENQIEEILYINLEDDRLEGFAISDFQTIMTAYGELFPELNPIIYLDEIQIINGWEKFARRLADQKYQVYITGSNAKMLSNEIATTLGGRFIPREIYPFSFYEYLKFKKIELSRNWKFSTNLLNKIRNLFDNYFIYGGFAENIDKSNQREWLNILLKKILLGDIITRNNIREANNILLLTRKLADSVMQQSTFSHLCNIIKSTGIKITRETIVVYLKYMQEAFLIFQIKNYNDNVVEKTTKCKTYFSDNGLLTVSALDTNTKLLENIVAINLWKKYGYYNENNIFYYNKNIEVDFYIPNENTAIQVCYKLGNELDQTYKRETSALLSISKYLDIKKLQIITYDEEKTIEINNKQIEIIPIWKWLLIN
ncbi:MAG: ATP-binding protein [Bacteroidales bacterium]|nr:ATP-binding protein [Bacteroidales bacterium]